ncbi:Nn.00g093290.m01.CDS01 [Neocucurbitaria sp. VM-36]
MSDYRFTFTSPQVGLHVALRRNTNLDRTMTPGAKSTTINCLHYSSTTPSFAMQSQEQIDPEKSVREQLRDLQILASVRHPDTSQPPIFYPASLQGHQEIPDDANLDHAETLKRLRNGYLRCISVLEKKNQGLRTKNEGLLNENAELQDESAGVQNENAELQNKNAVLQNEVNQAREIPVAMSAHIAHLENLLAVKDKESTDKSARIAELERFAGRMSLACFEANCELTGAWEADPRYNSYTGYGSQ